MRTPSRSGPAAWAVATMAVVVGVLVAGGSSASAEVEPTSAEAQELADRYAPIVVIKTQPDTCDSVGEPFAPMSVDVVLGNDDVLLRQASESDPIVQRAPTASDLHGRGEGFFLDFNGLALDPGCVYERDFDRYVGDSGPVVYAHVAQQADQPDRLALQYWFYWYFNDWNNTHESDWEFIQILFDASTIEEALASEPTAVGFAQHEGGEKADWNSDKLERVGDHPVVYPSAGSHATYFSSSTFLGRKGTEGFGCDTTLGPWTTLRPRIITLPHTVDADSEFAWLDFTGRWGERHGGPFNGPTGPNTKPRWDAPIDWFDDLRSASVMIPGADEGNATILDTFCNTVDFGSTQLRLFQKSPTQTIVILGAIALAVRAVSRRTAWSSVPAVPLRRRRRVGQMLRGALGSHWSSRGALAGIAVVYLPAAALVGAVAAIAGFSSGQAVAGALTTVMLVVSTALIAAFWHLASDDHERPLTGSLQLLRRRAPNLLATLVRAAAIVVGLAITVVGIPWAIRQLIRYQFVVPVVVTEGLDGADALTRSSALVRGRWWRTALTLAMFAVLSAVLSSVLQLVLLIAVDGVPLWVYLMGSFAALGLLVPIIATPPLLLYGDAVAVQRDAAEPSSV